MEGEYNDDTTMENNKCRESKRCVSAKVKIDKERRWKGEDRCEGEGGGDGKMPQNIIRRTHNAA